MAAPAQKGATVPPKVRAQIAFLFQPSMPVFLGMVTVLTIHHLVLDCSRPQLAEVNHKEVRKSPTRLQTLERLMQSLRVRR